MYDNDCNVNPLACTSSDHRLYDTEELQYFALCTSFYRMSLNSLCYKGSSIGPGSVFSNAAEISVLYRYTEGSYV